LKLGGFMVLTDTAAADDREVSDSDEGVNSSTSIRVNRLI
jgi:hypothetical protein